MVFRFIILFCFYPNQNLLNSAFSTFQSLGTEDESNVTSNVFEDLTVESVIHKEMERLRVRIFKNCQLVCWNDDRAALYVDEIESATFLFGGIEKRIRCVVSCVFLYAYLTFTHSNSWSASRIYRKWTPISSIVFQLSSWISFVCFWTSKELFILRWHN